MSRLGEKRNHANITVMPARSMATSIRIVWKASNPHQLFSEDPKGGRENPESCRLSGNDSQAIACCGRALYDFGSLNK
jgi:hypothetical protein